MHRQRGAVAEPARLGLVIDWDFHQAGRWVSIFAPHLVDGIIARFDPVIISSQQEYDQAADDLVAAISMEPGWAAPRLRFNGRHPAAVLVSDPHNKTSWFQDYVQANNISHVLSQYYSPFFHHFPDFPQDRFVHFPWAVPDAYIYQEEIDRRQASSEVAVFGAAASDAYTLRNWCRRQKGVCSFDNSGVENKQFNEAGYFDWLHNLDAVIAAGSASRRYQLVTPKYFEIASAGALLFGQHCPDLEMLGFDASNMLAFSRWSFRRKLKRYHRCPEDYLAIRRNGRALIQSRHAMSRRIDQLAGVLGLERRA